MLTKVLTINQIGYRYLFEQMKKAAKTAEKAEPNATVWESHNSNMVDRQGDHILQNGVRGRR